MTAEQWNELVRAYQGSFLQSWEWGTMQERFGRSVERVAVDGMLTQCIVHALPANRSYLFSPYGPVGNNTITSTPTTQAALLEQIMELAERYKAIFWRYERYGEKFGDNIVADVHPRYTQIVELGDVNTMEANLKPKWRYNIRLAERKGVTIRVSQSMNDMDSAYTLLQNTAKRQGIRIHPLSYYQLMLDVLAPANMLTLYLAEYNNQVIAANIMIGFNDTMTYVHGGTDHAHRSVMAPHALQWQAMKDAAAAGYRYYDLFGVAPPNAPDHPWAGITRFKEGFGGELKEYTGTYELPLQRVWYNAYRVAKRIWI